MVLNWKDPFVCDGSQVFFKLLRDKPRFTNQGEYRKFLKVFQKESHGKCHSNADGAFVQFLCANSRAAILHKGYIMAIFCPFTVANSTLQSIMFMRKIGEKSF